MSTTDKKPLTPLNPHLIYAFVFWLEENGFRPNVVFDQSSVTDEALRKYINHQGQLILNIGRKSVQDLRIGPEFLSFFARFNGVATPVTLPLSGLLYVYTPDAADLIFIPPAEHLQVAMQQAVEETPKPAPVTPVSNVTSITKVAPKKNPFTLVKND